MARNPLLKKPKENLKTKQASGWLTPGEYDKLIKLSEKVDKSVSSIVRELLLKVINDFENKTESE